MEIIELIFLKGRFQGKTSLLHVHSRKEIENYLLVPSALEKAIQERLYERKDRGSLLEISEIDYLGLFMEVFDELKDDAQSQITTFTQKFEGKSGKDPSTIFLEVSRWITAGWKEFTFKSSVVGGRSAFSLLNKKLGERFGISITPFLVISKMKKDEIPFDLIEFFKELETFCRN